MCTLPTMNKADYTKSANKLKNQQKRKIAEYVELEFCHPCIVENIPVWLKIWRLDYGFAQFKQTTAQTTTFGEIIIPKEKYSLLGFVKGDDLQVKENTWFIILNSKQINLLTDCLKEKSTTKH
jgi:hypothetical protein